MGQPLATAPLMRASVWTAPAAQGPRGQGLKEGRGDVTLSRWGQRVEKRKAILCLGPAQRGLVGNAWKAADPQV